MLLTQIYLQTPFLWITIFSFRLYAANQNIEQEQIEIQRYVDKLQESIKNNDSITEILERGNYGSAIISCLEYCDNPKNNSYLLLDGMCNILSLHKRSRRKDCVLPLFINGIFGIMNSAFFISSIYSSESEMTVYYAHKSLLNIANIMHNSYYLFCKEKLDDKEDPNN